MPLQHVLYKVLAKLTHKLQAVCLPVFKCQADSLLLLVFKQQAFVAKPRLSRADASPSVNNDGRDASFKIRGERPTPCSASSSSYNSTLAFGLCLELFFLCLLCTKDEEKLAKPMGKQAGLGCRLTAAAAAAAAMLLYATVAVVCGPVRLEVVWCLLRCYVLEQGRFEQIKCTQSNKAQSQRRFAHPCPALIDTSCGVRARGNTLA